MHSFVDKIIKRVIPHVLDMNAYVIDNISVSLLLLFPLRIVHRYAYALSTQLHRLQSMREIDEIKEN